MTTWTDERVGHAKTMWKAGAPYREIADALGVSRNSVSGLIFRLGLANKIKPRKPELTREQKAERQERARLDRGLTQTIRMSRFNSGKKITERPVGKGFLGLNLQELAWIDGVPAQCRYPQGEGPFVFCGQEVQQHSSYCPEHHRLCYGRPAATPEQIEQARRARVAKNRVYGRAA